jgi:UDP-GlcNAc:undecaprenyl-phosphate/decaprenyl-phosphate GlcNAc-1-phosphate transferase
VKIFYLQSIFLLSLIFSLGLTPLFAKLARRLRIVDRPAHRKTHKEPVSYLGGLAVLLAFILAFALTFYFYRALDDIFTSRGFTKAFLIVGSSVGVALIGLWDDIRNIRPRYKLMGQFFFPFPLLFFGLSRWSTPSIWWMVWTAWLLSLSPVHSPFWPGAPL